MNQKTKEEENLLKQQKWRQEEKIHDNNCIDLLIVFPHEYKKIVIFQYVLKKFVMIQLCSLPCCPKDYRKENSEMDTRQQGNECRRDGAVIFVYHCH